jgi:malate dehydrogenase
MLTTIFLAVVAGAAGGIGQPLSLLLKASPLVDHLSLYDVVNTPGVTADLSHISSVATIDGFLPADGGLKKALTGADIVVIPAGIPRESPPQPGSERLLVSLAVNADDKGKRRMD